MSKTSAAEKLQNAIGSRVRRLYVELWADSLQPISVGIEIEGGPALIFCCAGDGSVCITKGRIGESGENTLVRTFDVFTGELLKSVDTFAGSIHLQIATHRLSISNFDDDLEITLNNEQAPQ